MTVSQQVPVSQRLEEAIAELQERIAGRYPEATFSVGVDEDPNGTYLTATIDLDDMGEVNDAFLDRLVELQVEEQLPIFVVTVRPLARNVGILARQRAALAAQSNA
jgi:hypothetical protein